MAERQSTHAVAEVARRLRNTAARIAARAIVLVSVYIAELIFVNACANSEVDRYETCLGRPRHDRIVH